MLRPCPNDPLKVRRALAFFSVIYALLLWPNLLVFYTLRFGLQEGLVAELLTYIGVLASGPIGAYLWATLRKQVESD